MFLCNITQYDIQYTMVYYNEHSCLQGASGEGRAGRLPRLRLRPGAAAARQHPQSWISRVWFIHSSNQKPCSSNIFVSCVQLFGGVTTSAPLVTNVNATVLATLFITSLQDVLDL